MSAEQRLEFILRELEDMRKYVNTLANDKTINHYTAGTFEAKIQRCENIAIKTNPIISKNR